VHLAHALERRRASLAPPAVPRAAVPAKPPRLRRKA
jgi:hypothetical protein